jgi:gamma-glutamylcyclotransferase (GGCT)/AIG2-like uncharacterized protein YtfP
MRPDSRANPAPDQRPSTRLAGITAERDGLFVYGTLMFPEVLDALLGRVPDSAAASISGWKAVGLSNRVYPGLVQASASTTNGRLLTGLSRDEWQVLDDFEDDTYELRQLSLDHGAQAWSYIWPDHHSATSIAWQPTEFASRHLPTYAANCAAPRRG